MSLDQMGDWLATGRLKKLNSNAIGNTFGEAVFESPSSGLKYTTGSADGHRIAHVLKHADASAANATDPFGVFDKGTDIIKLIDDAWAIKQVKKIPKDAKGGYNIEMPAAIGVEGGPAGSQQATKIVRLIVSDDGRVITAYPFIPSNAP